MENSSTLAGIPSAHASPLHSRSVIFGIALLLVLLVGWMDYLIRWELSVFVFYLIPILWVVWQDQRQLAVGIAILCGLAWWLANTKDFPFRSDMSYHFAALGRMIYFILIALGGNAIRAKQASDRALIATLRKIRQLERGVVEAGEHEQRRIGRDLHDGLCQHLAATACAARSLADDLRAHSLPEAEKAAEIEELLRDSIVQARDLARGICPVLTDGAALEAVLDDLARTATHLTGIEVSFSDEGGSQMVDAGAALHLYRIAQEALNNALRHSRASKVNISLSYEDETVRLAVVDDGVGPPENPDAHEGMGMKTMEYRSRVIGATLEIRRHYPRGTLVACSYKINQQLRHANTP